MTIDERLDRIDQSMTEMRQEMARYARDHSADNAALTRYVQELRAETISRLEIIDSRLSLLAAGLTSLDSRMLPFTKALLDFGELANRLQIEQSRIARLIDPAA